MQSYMKRETPPGEITQEQMQNDVGEPLFTMNLSPTSHLCRTLRQCI